MGQTWSSFYSYWFPNQEYKLVLVGLDNAGKTTTLYRLHLGQAVVTHPTVGSNVEQITFRNLQFEVWDLGGQANLRPSWQTYYKAAHAVIMVVDSTDRARVGIAKNELFSLLGHEHLSGAALLVLANKQDLKDAMRPAELSECLGLHTIKTHSYHIQSSCATTGEGLQEGLAWVAQKVHGQTK
ncbi:MAG: ADP-ribosylation factor C1 [Trebouxia sp. A1-2]|nr:MAG: ADP-ribosylation factor C1 [Trebouxia sp. A1-2]